MVEKQAVVLSFSGHILERLFVVLVRAEPHKGYMQLRECGTQRHSAKGAWKIWSLKWQAPTKKVPRRHLDFTLVPVLNIELGTIYTVAIEGQYWKTLQVFISSDGTLYSYIAAFSPPFSLHLPKSYYNSSMHAVCWGEADYRVVVIRVYCTMLF